MVVVVTPLPGTWPFAAFDELRDYLGRWVYGYAPVNTPLPRGINQLLRVLTTEAKLLGMPVPKPSSSSDASDVPTLEEHRRLVHTEKEIRGLQIDISGFSAD